MNLKNMTMQDISRLQNKKLLELIEFAGSRGHLAFMLSISSHTVDSWVERGRISKNGARDVESHQTLGMKFKASDLRPDLLIGN